MDRHSRVLAGGLFGHDPGDGRDSLPAAAACGTTFRPESPIRPRAAALPRSASTPTRTPIRRSAPALYGNPHGAGLTVARRGSGGRGLADPVRHARRPARAPMVRRPRNRYGALPGDPGPAPLNQ